MIHLGKLKQYVRILFSDELNNVPEDVNVYLKRLEYITTLTYSQSTQNKKNHGFLHYSKGKF